MCKMKLGMISGETPDCFDYAKSKHLDFIEICRNYDEETLKFIDNIASVKESMARTGLSVQSVGRWNSFPKNKGELNREVFEMNCKLIDAAAAVGSEIFVCGCNYDESISLYRNYTFAIRYFADIMAYAGKYGMKTAVCNCSWNNFVYSPREWQVVLGELPDLMIKFDPSHAFYRNPNTYIEELQEWIGRVAHMHVKGACIINGKQYDDPPVGMDQIDWKTIFAILYREKYEGGLSLEPHSSTWHRKELKDGGVDFALRFIRPFLMK